MKITMFLILNTLLLLGSCGDHTTMLAPNVKNSLTERLENAPEVHNARALFTKYSHALTEIGPNELVQIHARARAFGLDPVRADLADMERWLDDKPYKAAYLKCARLLKAYQASLLAVEKQFPELASIPDWVSVVLQLEDDLPLSHQAFPHQIVQMHNTDVTSRIHHQ